MRNRSGVVKLSIIVKVTRNEVFYYSYFLFNVHNCHLRHHARSVLHHQSPILTAHLYIVKKTIAYKQVTV